MSDQDDLLLGPLNEPQRRAALHAQGPLLILAGAGSGKTKALTHRIAHLIAQGVPPWQILAVTFTNKAATEMKTRITNLLHMTEGEDLAAWGTRSAKLPVMGTFHAICARILRKDIVHLGRDRSFVIYDQDDQERLMKQVFRDLKIEESELKPKAALGYIGRFKCEAIGPDEALKEATTDRMALAIQAFAAYNKALRQANALDFDDLIVETVRLFHEVPKVLERYQETWRFLNVDEYQDTNHAQYLMITLLAQKYRNLCVIGDPDQSIYAFRGADIRNILEFEREYKDASRIKLEQNYRSTQLILSAADAVIAANPNRPEKTMWSERKTGPKITVNEVADEKKEAEEAVRRAQELKREGIPLNEQVILYRTNAQSRMFEEACMRSGLPYRIVGGLKFYARREIKDVLAYLHVILNPSDVVSLLRIINVPSRKIGETTLTKIRDWSQAKGLSLWSVLGAIDDVPDVNEGTKDRIRNFTETIVLLQEKTKTLVVADLVDELLRKIQMEKWLKDDTDPPPPRKGLRGADEGEERWQNVRELLSVTRKYDKLEPHLSLVSFLEEVALVSEVDKLATLREDALTLMTVHLCKGLEFEHVTIVGCEEGIFPHASSMYDREQLEEERRLMYVGMTRAKTHLDLLFTRSRMLWGETRANAGSRFLDDLPDAVIERRSDSVLSAFAWASERGEEAISGQRSADSARFPKLQTTNYKLQAPVEFNQDLALDDDGNQENMAEGTRVEHAVYGKGTVTALRGGIADIAFDSGQKKSFALSIAPLKIL